MTAQPPSTYRKWSNGRRGSYNNRNNLPPRFHHQGPAEPPTSNPRSTLEQLRQRVAQLEKENDALSRELKYERIQAEKENCPRDVQLEGLKEYLDMHDKSGFAEVSAKVDLVNDLVDQLASDVSEQYQTPATSAKSKDSKLARESSTLKVALGYLLVELLDTCDPTDPNVAVIFQYAVQTAALYEVFKLCDVDFAHRIPGPNKHIFNLISKSVQKQAIQPIYGRWRALAHRHLRAIESQESRDKKAADFVSGISTMFVDIHDAILGENSSTKDMSIISPHVDLSLKELNKHAISLSTMMKEEVISTDFALFAPQAGQVYDPKEMEFPYDPPDDGQPRKEDLVICTVKFGLVARGKRGRENGEVERSHRKKAQVFTQEVCEVILGPIEAEGRKQT